MPLYHLDRIAFRRRQFLSHTGRMEWPAGFIWGTGASSTQTEGAAPQSDWWDWERAGHAPMSGDGNGFSTRYPDDFRAMAELGLHHHRLSIEWARIEPTEGNRDERAIDHYRNVLISAREAGVTPWICLHHFTLPRWFAAVGGFLHESNRTTHWRRHVDFVAETFGDLAGGWKPVNEVNYYAGIGYLGRGWPPGHKDYAEFCAVSENIHLASSEAAVLLRGTGLPVSSVFGLSEIVRMDDAEASVTLEGFLRSIFWNAGLGLFRDGILQIPSRPVLERPDLVGAYDLLGFSYYSTIGISEGRVVSYPLGAKESPLGYGISSDGLDLVIKRLEAEVPDTPLLVAEYGIGTDDDDERARYITDGLRIVSDAIGGGTDVRGFFHWTAVDNYEWLHGYDLRFGLIDRDRKVRKSAGVLATEALGGRS